MAIRQSDLSWTNYKKAARNLKIKKPSITPQQIIGRIGYPTKNGQRISITSDGKGGVKERNRTAHDARNALRQKRRRIQTGKLTPEQAAESRQKKDSIRASGKEADHDIEIGFLGEQLERLEAAGGDVPQALKILRDAGYALGDMPDNLQALSPEDNKLKRDQLQALQRYLGSREALGQSPSARRPDLIVTGEDLSIPLFGFPEEIQQGATTTAPSESYTPVPLGGIDFSRIPQQTKTPPMTKIPPVTVMESNGKENGNGNGNGNGFSGYNGNGNGNGHVDLNKLNETLINAGVIAAQSIGTGLMLSPLAR